jgi:hypothetical protein
VWFCFHDDHLENGIDREKKVAPMLARLRHGGHRHQAIRDWLCSVVRISDGFISDTLRFASAPLVNFPVFSFYLNCENLVKFKRNG